MKRIKLHRLSELVYTGIYLVSPYQAHPLPELLFRGFKGGLLDPADGTAGKGRSPYPLEYQDPDTEGYEAQSPFGEIVQLKYSDTLSLGLFHRTTFH